MSEKGQINIKSLGSIGLLGGLGGAIAWAPYQSSPDSFGIDLGWNVFIVGAAKGSLLALTIVGPAGALWQRKAVTRWIAIPIVGWISSWLSHIPIMGYLDLWALQHSNRPAEVLLNVISWPFITAGLPIRTQPLWGFLWPHLYFVGHMYFYLLTIRRVFSSKKLWVHIVAASASGSVGSLLWGGRDMVLFTVFGGTIWGSLVGFGVWKSQQDV